MYLTQLVAITQGVSSRILDIITVPDWRQDGWDQLLEEQIKEVLRRDREKGLTLGNVAFDNPSKEISELQYGYPRYRMIKYTNIPFPMDDHDIFDAFVCLGSRFGIERVEVFVELCRSRSSGIKEYWANVYYVTPGFAAPVLIIRFDKNIVEFEDEEILARIARDRIEREQALARRRTRVLNRNQGVQEKLPSLKLEGCTIKIEDKEHVVTHEGTVREVVVDDNTLVISCVGKDGQSYWAHSFPLNEWEVLAQDPGYLELFNEFNLDWCTVGPSVETPQTDLETQPQG